MTETPEAEPLQALLFDGDFAPVPSDTGYRGPIAHRVAGITYRQLDYWARTGLVVPSIRNAEGSGTQRLYSFRDILPARDDESEGAVSLAESVAFHDPLAGEAVTWHLFVDEDKDRARADEAHAVVRLVQDSAQQVPARVREGDAPGRDQVAASRPSSVMRASSGACW